MSRLPALMDPHRSQSPISIAASDTTYHSFNDIELFEPASPVTTLRYPHTKGDPLGSRPITRHDSGYESTYSGSSHGHSSKILHHRNAAQTRSQKRPTIQRVPKSSPASYPGRPSGQLSRASTPQKHHPTSYYYFPSPEAIAGNDEAAEESDPVSYPPPPPQTTHYWMSDRTRRLEYAAIDSASRGIKGWVMKHVVPDCFVPENNRRLTFDDDTGSVRRYRLELECDDSSIKEDKRGKKLGWLFRR
ncbi:hypothetical protein F5Y14DRAFT_223094 [Nemania sp. NC0429]|nr:hypothetical protein F5Y14DRAFT_223094 [Nemania sp. NC0429]